MAAAEQQGLHGVVSEKPKAHLQGLPVLFILHGVQQLVMETKSKSALSSCHLNTSFQTLRKREKGWREN